MRGGGPPVTGFIQLFLGVFEQRLAVGGEGLSGVALGGYTLLAVAPVLAMIRGVKIAENATDYSIQNTTRQALFLPTSREAKYKAKQVVDAFFWRAGDVLSAVLVFLGSQVLALAPRNFAIYSGDDATALALILLGGHGVISVTANVAPKLMHQMCAAALVGDVKKARELNLKLLALHQRLFVEANPIPVKWALAEMGMIEYGLRLPLAPLAEKFHQTVREALHEAGIALPGLRVVEGRG